MMLRPLKLANGALVASQIEGDDIVDVIHFRGVVIAATERRLYALQETPAGHSYWSTIRFEPASPIPPLPEDKKVEKQETR